MFTTIHARALDSGSRYDNLPILIVLCNMVIPLAAIPLTFLLVPNMKLTDKSPNFHKVNCLNC